MALTPEQQARRAGKVTASFIPALMAGNEQAMLREWQRIIEHPDYVEDDLSANWSVQLGIFAEPFILDWHERKTGPLTRRGEWVPHPEMPFVGATLDAYRASDRTVIDAKAPGGWRKLDDVLAYYTGQSIVQRACTKADKAALLVMHGAAEPVEYVLEWPEQYEVSVWERIHWFWDRCESLQAPCAIPAVAGAMPAMRVVTMEGNNEWAANAADWLANRDAAARFADAAKTLKAMLEPDVKQAKGHGVMASRARNGAITIKPER